MSAAYLKTSILFDAFDAGRTEIMPFVLAANDVGVRPLSEITREDRVERVFLPLLDRMGLPLFRQWVLEKFTNETSAL